jgi:hypothetical protein
MELMVKKKITPKEWLAMVMTVPKAYRCEIAHMIWWDWFSGRQTTERWSELDLFLKNPTWSKPTDAQLIKGLMLCRYSETHAANRIGNKGNKGQSKK